MQLQKLWTRPISSCETGGHVSHVHYDIFVDSMHVLFKTSKKNQQEVLLLSKHSRSWASARALDTLRTSMAHLSSKYGAVQARSTVHAFTQN